MAEAEGYHIIRTGYLWPIKEDGTIVDPNLRPEIKPIDLECLRVIASL